MTTRARELAEELQRWAETAGRILRSGSQERAMFLEASALLLKLEAVRVAAEYAESQDCLPCQSPSDDSWCGCVPCQLRAALNAAKE